MVYGHNLLPSITIFDELHSLEFESVGHKLHKTFFIDLFVGVSGCFGGVENKKVVNRFNDVLFVLFKSLQVVIFDRRAKARVAQSTFLHADKIINLYML
jgi:hypothetical protein